MGHRFFNKLKIQTVLQSILRGLEPSEMMISLFQRCFILVLPLALAGHIFWEKPAAAPLQYQMFCLQHPHQCQPDQVSAINYGWGVLQELKQVNRQVNAEIKPKHEKRDIWSMNVPQGDCEDYVLTKRERLAQAGVPSGAMRVAVVDTEKGERHAVLIVKTSRGNLVLDNRRDTILFEPKSGYRFIKTASADPLKWVTGPI